MTIPASLIWLMAMILEEGRPSPAFKRRTASGRAAAARPGATRRAGAPAAACPAPGTGAGRGADAAAPYRERSGRRGRRARRPVPGRRCAPPDPGQQADIVDGALRRRDQAEVAAAGAGAEQLGPAGTQQRPHRGRRHGVGLAGGETALEERGAAVPSVTLSQTSPSAVRVTVCPVRSACMAWPLPARRRLAFSAGTSMVCPAAGPGSAPSVLRQST